MLSLYVETLDQQRTVLIMLTAGAVVCCEVRRSHSVLQLPIPDSVLVSVVLNSVRVFQRFKVAEINLYSVVVHFWHGRKASEQFNPKFQVA